MKSQLLQIGCFQREIGNHRKPARTSVLLLLPPPGDISQAYLSTPSLAAVLRRSGFATDQRDLGLEAFYYLTSPQRLEKALRKLRDGVYFESTAQRHRAILAGETCVESIEESKAVLRDRNRFFEDSLYIRSLNIVRKSMALIAQESAPVKWTLNNYGWPGVHDSSKLLAMLDTGVPNPIGEALDILIDETVAAYQVVGISVTYPSQLTGAICLARRLRQVAPHTHVCVGGALVSPLRKTFVKLMLEREMFDSVVLNEGETAICAIADEVDRSGSRHLDRTLLPNTITRFGDWTSDGTRAHEENLDSLPTPDYCGLPMDQYVTPHHVILISTSRGCYYRKCAFCTVSLALGSYRHRASELVVSDIGNLAERHNTRHFFLSEDAVSPVRMRTLSEAIIEARLDIVWQCEARLEKALKHSILEKAFSAGCRRIMFGVESASQRVLDHMKKSIKTEEVVRVLRECNELGIGYDLLTFVGFPTETAEEAQKTIEFLLVQSDKANYFTFGSFLLQPDAPAGATPEAFGICKVHPAKGDLDDSLDYEVVSGMTQQEVKKLERRSLPILRQAYRNFDKILYGTHILLFMDRYGEDSISKIDLYGGHLEGDNLLNLIPAAVSRADLVDEEVFFNRAVAEFYGIDPRVAQVLRAIDGKHTLGEFIDLFGKDDPMVTLRLTKILTGLARQGVFRVTDAFSARKAG